MHSQKALQPQIAHGTIRSQSGPVTVQAGETLTRIHISKSVALSTRNTTGTMKYLAAAIFVLSAAMGNQSDLAVGNLGPHLLTSTRAQ